MGDLVTIENLTKKFGGFTAVDNISFNVAQGEVLGFLGPNGAGKTTTMRMITGFLAPTEGAIKVVGNDVVEEPVAVKQSIGYLPEGGPLYVDMTPRDFLHFVAEVRGLSGSHLKERLDFVVEHLGIGEVLDQLIDTLSKGYKRRVALAQAILHDPKVLILDEPTDGLDPNQKHEVRELIHKMAPEKAIVISTHILEEVSAVCSRAVIIAHGKIVKEGTPEAIAKAVPENDLTAAFRKLTMKEAA